MNLVLALYFIIIGLLVYLKDSGDEPQRLAEFITDLMEVRILNEVFYKLPDNSMKSFTVDGIRKAVGGSVKAATSSAWLSSASAVRSMSTTIQASVKDLIKPLVEKETEIKKTIVEKVFLTHFRPLRRFICIFQ